MVRDHRIETYSFNSGLSGQNFDAYSWRTVNGILMGVFIGSNNYQPSGTLALTVSGLNYPIWSFASGTAAGTYMTSGAFYPLASAVNQVNSSLSGTNSTGVYTDIPIFGNLRLLGSALGAGSSCSEVTVIYRMG